MCAKASGNAFVNCSDVHYINFLLHTVQLHLEHPVTLIWMRLNRVSKWRQFYTGHTSIAGL